MFELNTNDRSNFIDRLYLMAFSFLLENVTQKRHLKIQIRFYMVTRDNTEVREVRQTFYKKKLLKVCVVENQIFLVKILHRKIHFVRIKEDNR